MKSKEKEMENRIITIPNILSLFRLLITPLFVWLYCVKHEYILAAITLLVSNTTDVIDGFIARKFNMISNVGKILDPVADKVTQLCVILCLLTHFPIMIIPFIIMAIKELFLGITGCLVIKKTGEVFSASWHGKVNTCLLYIMMTIHILWYNIPDIISDILVSICIIMMIISLTMYGIANFNKIKKNSKNS